MIEIVDFIIFVQICHEVALMQLNICGLAADASC